MAKVVMKSWRVGMKKISLSKLQNEMLGIGLRESFDNTHLLLDDIEIVLEIDDLDLAKKFLEEADKIGVNCKLIEE